MKFYRSTAPVGRHRDGNLDNPKRGARSALFALLCFLIALNGGPAQAQPLALEQIRRNYHFQFSGTETAVAFPVPLSAKTNGILFFDRRTKTKKLIVAAGGQLEQPFLSSDGHSVLIVKISGSEHQLLSCDVSKWKCAVLLSTLNSIHAPAFTEDGGVLLALSPVVVGSGGRKGFVKYSVHLLAKDAREPERLTRFEFGYLISMSIAGSKLLITARYPWEKALFEDPATMVGGESELFLLELDSRTKKSSNQSKSWCPYSRCVIHLRLAFWPLTGICWHFSIKPVETSI